MNPQLQFLQAPHQFTFDAGATPKTKKKGNFLTSLIPSGGGIAGSAAGAALGTAVLPGVGTLAGALLGGALGGGAGKVAENAVEHNKLTSGVAGEAALNGLFGAGPLRLGKFGIDAARGIKAGAGLADAITNAGATAVGPSAIKTAISNKLGGASDNLSAKALGLTKAQKTKVLEKTGESAGAIAKKYGIKSAADIPKATAPLYEQFNSTVAAIPRGFTKEEVAAAFKNVYGPMLAEGTPLGTQTVGASLKAEAENLLKGIKGTISPTELNKKRQAFDKLAYKFKNSDPNAYDVNKMGRDVLSKLIHGAADSAGLTAEGGQTLRQLGQEISKLEDLGKQAKKNIEGAGGSTLFGLGNLPGAVIGGGAGVPGAVIGGVTNAALNSPVGRRAAASTAERLATKAARSATKNPYSVLSVGKREAIPATGNLASALLQSSSIQPTTTTTTTAMTTPMSANISGLNQTDANMSTSSSPFAPQNLESAIQQILSNGGTIDDVSKFVTIAGAVQKAQATAQPAKLNSTQQQQANNANSGLAAIQQINDIVSNDPLATIRAAVPTNVGKNLAGGAVLNTAIGEAADVISRLRTGAAINAEEEKFYRSKLPSVGDTPEVIRYKLGVLSDLFTQFANPQAAQPDLASAVLAAQGAY